MSDKNSCSGDCAGCGSDCLSAGENGATITLSLDDGVTVECAVLTIYPAADKQYIALLPLDAEGENESGEVYLYRFTEKNGEPVLENIEDDDEYEAASDGFDQWLDEQEFNELVYDEDEEDSDENE